MKKWIILILFLMHCVSDKIIILNSQKKESDKIRIIYKTKLVFFWGIYPYAIPGSLIDFSEECKDGEAVIYVIRKPPDNAILLFMVLLTTAGAFSWIEDGIVCSK